MVRLFPRADPEKAAARALFTKLARQARNPDFHLRFKVPDTIDGRFDLLTLHGFLAMEALKGCGEDGERIGTHLATAIFEALEEALRELGVGDIGISRRIKAMADAFYGRLSAYGAAADRAAMATALQRNLYRGDPERGREAEHLSEYVLRTLSLNCGDDSFRALLGGEMRFAPLPGD
jgi:cytochrome b pre-mRNA-processing protein 3